MRLVQNKETVELCARNLSWHILFPKARLVESGVDVVKMTLLQRRKSL